MGAIARIAAAAILAALISTDALAVTVQVAPVDLFDADPATDRWRFDYVVTGGLDAFAGVQLVYDATRYAGLLDATQPPPSDWSVAVTPPIPQLGADGLVTLTANAMIAADQALQLSVSLVRVGPGAFPPQPVIEFDASFATVSESLLQIAPEPGPWMLLAPGSVAVLLLRCRRSR